MESAYRKEALRSLGLAAWGLLTLVLLFTVVMLINEMLKAGQDPLGAIRGTPDTTTADAAPARPTTASGMKDVALFFADPTGRMLLTESARIEAADSTIANCRTALERLIAGPRESLTPVLPDATKVRAIYLRENGELVIDFSRELQAAFGRMRSASVESLLAYGVVQTVTQRALHVEGDPQVKTVRILIEGAPPSEGFPAHIDYSEPFRPDPRWVG